MERRSYHSITLYKQTNQAELPPEITSLPPEPPAPYSSDLLDYINEVFSEWYPTRTLQKMSPDTRINVPSHSNKCPLNPSKIVILDRISKVSILGCWVQKMSPHTAKNVPSTLGKFWKNRRLDFWLNKAFTPTHTLPISESVSESRKPYKLVLICPLKEKCDFFF